jgi:predicted  nucleic acid-binding Zn-ribbon protein
MSNLIPIKLAEQAIASLEADIDRLRSRYAEATQENARLKADVERLTFDPLTYLDDQGEWMPRHTHLAAVERLKAEVERMTSDIQMEKENEDRLVREWHKKASNEVYGLQSQVAALIDDQTRLKEQVERLTKAGDEVIHEWSSGHGTDVENFTKALWVWAVAKEGKQSK